MARFYAEIQGNRGLASRMGTPNSGIWGHIRGWDSGVKVICSVDEEGADVVSVYATGGSNGSCRERLIAQVYADKRNGPWIVTTKDHDDTF